MKLRVGDRFKLEYILESELHIYRVISVVDDGYLAYNVVSVCTPECGRLLHRSIVGHDERIICDEFDLMVRHLQEDNDAVSGGQ